MYTCTHLHIYVYRYAHTCDLLPDVTAATKILTSFSVLANWYGFTLTWVGQIQGFPDSSINITFGLPKSFPPGTQCTPGLWFLCLSSFSAARLLSMCPALLSQPAPLLWLMVPRDSSTSELFCTE